jgi:predicted DNA-binding protein with PD1-like motif
MRLQFFGIFELVLLAFLVMTSVSCTRKEVREMQTVVVRLKPGMDLKKELQNVVNVHGIEAGWLITCAGSLTQVSLRFANQPGATVRQGHFEIVALSGTLSRNGSHIHMSVSDSTGATSGGHVMDGNLVYTTAEIVIGFRNDLEFVREIDGSTPWPELQIKQKRP